MTPVCVLDASALVALLADGGETGEWVAQTISGAQLAAPDLALVETANVLRRHRLSGRLHPAEAALAHHDLLTLPVQLWPYVPLAERAWELATSLTSYDAAYVALAERLDAPLVTLDLRLARAPAARCPIVTPPGPRQAP